MSRTPARITQADVARAIRAEQDGGWFAQVIGSTPADAQTTV